MARVCSLALSMRVGSAIAPGKHKDGGQEMPKPKSKHGYSYVKCGIEVTVTPYHLFAECLTCHSTLDWPMTAEGIAHKDDWVSSHVLVRHESGNVLASGMASTPVHHPPTWPEERRYSHQE